MSKTKSKAMQEVADHLKGMVKSVMKRDILCLQDELKKMHTVMHTMENTIKSFEYRIFKISGEVSGIKESISPPSTPEKVKPVADESKKASTPVSESKTMLLTPVTSTTVSKNMMNEIESDDDSESIIEETDSVLEIELQLQNKTDFGFKFTGYNDNDKTYIMFVGFKEKTAMLSGFDKLTKNHYCVGLTNGDDTTEINSMTLAQFVSAFRLYKDGGKPFTVAFKELSDDQVNEYERYKEDQMKLERTELWKQYQLFFSDAHRKKNRRSHFRYRPDCKTCGDKSAIDVLTPMVRERHERLCNVLEKQISIAEMYDFLDNSSEEEWRECMRKADPHELLKKRKELDDDEVMCIPDPRKKAKTSDTPLKKALCDEFVQKGKGTMETYTQLRELFDEDRIRTMFNL